MSGSEAGRFIEGRPATLEGVAGLLLFERGLRMDRQRRVV
jgi:hypothetical protein